MQKELLLNDAGRLTFQAETDDAPAELYLYGDICSSKWDTWTNEDKCPQDVADFLASLEGVNELEIHINSGGGDVFGGIAIYNQLARYPCQKTVYIDGIAASIASVIAMAGDEIYFTNGAQMMVHKPWGMCVGNAADMQAYAEALDRCEQSILDIYATKLQDGVTRDDVQAMLTKEKWLRYDEAMTIFRVGVLPGYLAAAAANSKYYDRYQKSPVVQKAPQEQPKDQELERLALQLELLKL